jgi:CDP-diacylglycerol--serine O-phosphatidyltransferase
MNQSSDNKQHPGIYLLPNLFTTAGLFAGFYAIVAAMHARFEPACIAIFVAMVMDMLDGRVARMTGTESAFGAEYDSLTDMVAFGVAPALVIYSWGLSDLGKLGWLVAFLHTAGMALRLARFNTLIGKADKRFFCGLPAPAAAGVVVGYVWLQTDFDMPRNASYVGAILTFLVSVCMVSTLRYYSFKDIDLKGKVPFLALLIMVMVFVCISMHPPTVLFGAFALYALSGPCWTLWRLRGMRGLRRILAFWKR